MSHAALLPGPSHTFLAVGTSGKLAATYTVAVELKVAGRGAPGAMMVASVPDWIRS